MTAINYCSHFPNEVQKNSIRKSILCETEMWEDGSALVMLSRTSHQNTASPGLSSVLGTGTEHIAHTISYAYREG